MALFVREKASQTFKKEKKPAAVSVIETIRR